jgi:hypothetical protein
LITVITVPLLNLPDQLVARAGQPIYIVIRQLPPLLLSPPFELLPISFDLIPIHRTRPFLSEPKTTSKVKTGSHRGARRLRNDEQVVKRRICRANTPPNGIATGIAEPIE